MSREVKLKDNVQKTFKKIKINGEYHIISEEFIIKQFFDKIYFGKIENPFIFTCARLVFDEKGPVENFRKNVYFDQNILDIIESFAGVTYYTKYRDENFWHKAYFTPNNSPILTLKPYRRELLRKKGRKYYVIYEPFTRVGDITYYFINNPISKFKGHWDDTFLLSFMTRKRFIEKYGEKYAIPPIFL